MECGVRCDAADGLPCAALGAAGGSTLPGGWQAECGASASPRPAAPLSVPHGPIHEDLGLTLVREAASRPLAEHGPIVDRDLEDPPARGAQFERLDRVLVLAEDPLRQTGGPADVSSTGAVLDGDSRRRHRNHLPVAHYAKPTAEVGTHPGTDAAPRTDGLATRRRPGFGWRGGSHRRRPSPP